MMCNLFSRIRVGLIVCLLTAGFVFSIDSVAIAQFDSPPPPSNLTPLLKLGQKDSIPNEAKWKQIKNGLTKEQVITLVGEPQEKYGMGSGDKIVWAWSYYFKNNEERHLWISTYGTIFNVLIIPPKGIKSKQKQK
jgi:hypothetical protein